MTTLSQFFPSGSSGGGGDTIPATTTVAEVLLVGGGGSGARNCVSGTTYHASGGTAGGVLISKKYCFEQGCTYTIAIGAGGAAPPYSTGEPGTPSSIVGYGGSLTAYGAYCSGRHNFTLQLDQYTTHLGNPGGKLVRISTPGVCYNVGSGGGGALMRGDSGCRWYCPTSPYTVYGAGGGGGEGIASDISGTLCYYGGGGGGGSTNLCNISVLSPYGGIGGGSPAGNVGNGSANTGGGGGGGQSGACCGGAGGSGVLFIRYPTDYRAAPGTTGNTPTPAQPGYNVYRWNGDGSITF